MPSLKEAIAAKKAAQEPTLRRNPEIDAKLDRFIGENPDLREYYEKLSKDELIRKLMLGKMQRSEYANGRNAEIKAWVEEHPEIKASEDRKVYTVKDATFTGPYLAVFDFHGTLVKPNWKLAMARAAQRFAPEMDDEAARVWIEANTYGTGDIEVLMRVASLKPGTTLGPATPSLSVAAEGGTPDAAPPVSVNVQETFEPNDDPNDPETPLPMLAPGSLYLSYLTSAADTDFFRVTVPAAGTRTTIRLPGASWR